MKNIQKRESKRLCKGDQVRVLSGNDRGLTGEVLSRTNTHAIVRGINLRKKHVRKSEQHPSGAILEREQKIHLSNLVLFQNNRAVKLYASVKEGKKTLCYKDGEEVREYRVVGKA